MSILTPNRSQICSSHFQIKGYTILVEGNKFDGNMIELSSDDGNLSAGPISVLGNINMVRGVVLIGDLLFCSNLISSGLECSNILHHFRVSPPTCVSQTFRSTENSLFY